MSAPNAARNRIQMSAKVKELINRATLIPAQVVLWIQNRDVVGHGKLLPGAHPTEEFMVKLEDSAESAKFIHLIQNDEIPPEHNVLIRLGSAGVIGSRAPLLKITNSILTYQMPDELHMMQRRRDPRIQIPAHLNVTAEFHFSEEIPIRKPWKVLDLSAGGFSFVIPEALTSYFEKGTTLTNGLLHLKTKHITFNGEVAAVIRLQGSEGAGACRVGVSFTYMNDFDRLFISKFVLDQTARFMR